MTKLKETKWENIEGRFNLAGVQYSDYQLVCVRLKPGTVVRFIGEPSNLYDKYAIRVETKEGIKLGYVPSRSIQQSELWECRSKKQKCIGVITAFNKTNPTWRMITVQAKRTKQPVSTIPKEIPFI